MEESHEKATKIFLAKIHLFPNMEGVKRKLSFVVCFAIYSIARGGRRGLREIRNFDSYLRRSLKMVIFK